MKVANFPTIPQLGESGLPSLLSSVPDADRLSQEPGDVKVATNKNGQRKEIAASFDALLAAVAGQAQNPPLVPSTSSKPAQLEVVAPVKVAPTTQPIKSEASQPIVPSADLPELAPAISTITTATIAAVPQKAAATGLRPQVAKADDSKADTSKEVKTDIPKEVLSTSTAPNALVDITALLPHARMPEIASAPLPMQSPPPMASGADLPVPASLPMPNPGPEIRESSKPKLLTSQVSRTTDSIPIPADLQTVPPDSQIVPKDAQIALPATGIISDRSSTSVTKSPERIPDPEAIQPEVAVNSESSITPAGDERQQVPGDDETTPSKMEVSPSGSVARNFDEETVAVEASEAHVFTSRGNIEPAEINSPVITAVKLPALKEELAPGQELRETNPVFVGKIHFYSSPPNNVVMDESTVANRSFEVTHFAIASSEFQSNDPRPGADRIGGIRPEAAEEKLAPHKASLRESSLSLQSSSQTALETPTTAHLREVADTKPLSEQIAASVQAHREDLADGKPIELQLRLDPPELGSIRVHLRMSDDVVSVRLIVGDEAATRIVENQLPDLRQSLAERGLAFARCDVSCDSGRQHQSAFGQDSDRSAAFAPTRPIASSRMSPVAVTRSAARAGRVDVWA